MKLIRLFNAAMLLCVLAALASPALSQEKQGAAKMTPDMQEMMKKWTEAATPGEPHKFFEQFVGKWDMATRMWMEGPGKPPAETKGTAEIRWIMDGRFILEEVVGQVMGQPHKGLGVTGYDNFKKKYVGYWLDNTSTALFNIEGSLDQTGKVLTSYGRMDEPMTGEHDKLIKFVTRVVSKDKRIFEIYDLVGSPGEFKAVEIVYTRKQ
jgi:Protein of unknown function (DUF1579)